MFWLISQIYIPLCVSLPFYEDHHGAKWMIGEYTMSQWHSKKTSLKASTKQIQRQSHCSGLHEASHSVSAWVHGGKPARVHTNTHTCKCTFFLVKLGQSEDSYQSCHSSNIISVQPAWFSTCYCCVCSYLFYPNTFPPLFLSSHSQNNNIFVLYNTITEKMEWCTGKCFQ